jgi:hypothetical protein
VFSVNLFDFIDWTKVSKNMSRFQKYTRMIKDDERIVVGNWFCQYFSIELKNMTYIQREHIPL